MTFGLRDIVSDKVSGVFEDVVCGCAFGIVTGICDVSFFTQSETEEIINLKKLAVSTMAKAPEFRSDPMICKGIKAGNKAMLAQFTNNASPELVSAGVVTAAEVVCNKSFKARFTDLLGAACLNLVGCG